MTSIIFTGVLLLRGKDDQQRYHKMTDVRNKGPAFSLKEGIQNPEEKKMVSSEFELKLAKSRASITEKSGCV